MLFSPTIEGFTCHQVCVFLYWRCGHVSEHETAVPRYCPVCTGEGVKRLTCREELIGDRHANV